MGFITSLQLYMQGQKVEVDDTSTFAANLLYQALTAYADGDTEKFEQCHMFSSGEMIKYLDKVLEKPRMAFAQSYQSWVRNPRCLLYSRCLIILAALAENPAQIESALIAYAIHVEKRLCYEHGVHNVTHFCNSKSSDDDDDEEWPIPDYKYVMSSESRRSVEIGIDLCSPECGKEENLGEWVRSMIPYTLKMSARQFHDEKSGERFSTPERPDILTRIENASEEELRNTDLSLLLFCLNKSEWTVEKTHRVCSILLGRILTWNPSNQERHRLSMLRPWIPNLIAIFLIGVTEDNHESDIPKIKSFIQEVRSKSTNRDILKITSGCSEMLVFTEKYYSENY